jgi:hypothetical protein
MIKNCMKRVVYSVPTTATIRQAAALAVKRHINLLPIFYILLYPLFTR